MDEQKILDRRFEENVIELACLIHGLTVSEFNRWEISLPRTTNALSRLSFTDVNYLLVELRNTLDK